MAEKEEIKCPMKGWRRLVEPIPAPDYTMTPTPNTMCLRAQSATCWKRLNITFITIRCPALTCTIITLGWEWKPRKGIASPKLDTLNQLEVKQTMVSKSETRWRKAASPRIAKQASAPLQRSFAIVSPSSK